MKFEFPTISQARYRLWRLRRLIAVATSFPFVIFAVTGFFGLNGLAGSTLGLATLAVILLVIIGGHATLFPNSSEETLAISLVLGAFALLSPVFSGSFFGWLVFIAFAIWILMSGQTRISFWQMGTAPKPTVIRASVNVPGDPRATRNWFPLRPNTERGHYRCGAVEDHGAFPVWYDMPVFDICSELNIPQESDYDTAEEYCAAIGLEPGDPGFDEIAESWQDTEEAFPSFWAMIEEDTDALQRTLILDKTDDPKATEWPVETIVEHHFRPARNGCKVTEIETPSAFPWGQSLMIWLTDFQMDGLIYLRDLLAERESNALKDAHRWSILTLVGQWFMARQMNRMNEA